MCYVSIERIEKQTKRINDWLPFLRALVVHETHYRNEMQRSNGFHHLMVLNAVNRHLVSSYSTNATIVNMFHIAPYLLDFFRSDRVLSIGVYIIE